MALEAFEAQEREKVAEKRLDELRGEYEQLSEQLRQEVQTLHSELYRTLRVQAEIAPKMQGLRYEFQRLSGDYKHSPLVFSYPSDSQRTALVNLALSANDQNIGMVWALLNQPQPDFDELLNAEKSSYTQKPRPAVVTTHESRRSKMQRGEK
jgi:hypothetical protein